MGLFSGPDSTLVQMDAGILFCSSGGRLCWEVGVKKRGSFWQSSLSFY